MEVQFSPLFPFSKATDDLRHPTCVPRRDASRATRSDRTCLLAPLAFVLTAVRARVSLVSLAGTCRLVTHRVTARPFQGRSGRECESWLLPWSWVWSTHKKGPERLPSRGPPARQPLQHHSTRPLFPVTNSQPPPHANKPRASLPQSETPAYTGLCARGWTREQRARSRRLGSRSSSFHGTVPSYPHVQAHCSNAGRDIPLHGHGMQPKRERIPRQCCASGRCNADPCRVDPSPQDRRSQLFWSRPEGNTAQDARKTGSLRLRPRATCRVFMHLLRNAPKRRTPRFLP